MREEKALYVVAALLLIVVIGVAFPIYGDVNSIPDAFTSAWVNVKGYFTNVIYSAIESKWPLYIATGALIITMFAILVRIIRRMFRKRPPRKKSLKSKRFRVRVRRAYRGIFDYIFGFIAGILNVIRRFLQVIINFMHVVLSFLYVALLVAIIYYLMQSFPEPIYGVQSVLTDSKFPEQFQGLKGGLTLFLFILLGVTAGFILLAFLARMFARIIALGVAQQPKIIGWIIAYLLYGVSVILTVAIFSKLAAALCGVVFFILVPIVASLIGLIVEEAR